MGYRSKDVLKKLCLVLVLLQTLATNDANHNLLRRSLKEKPDVGISASFPFEDPTIQHVKSDSTLNTRLRTQNGRSLKQQDDVKCSLTPSGIEAIYNPATGVWTLTDNLLEQDVGIIQAAIDCSSEDDVISLETTTTLQPPKTIIIPWSLTLSANPGALITQNRQIPETDSKVKFTCTEETDLFSIRGGSVRIANIIFIRCSSSADIVSLNMTCENGDSNNEVELHHVEFEDNMLSGDAKLIATTNPRCSKLTLHDVALFENTCSGAGCISLAAANSFTNVRISDNSIAANPVVSHAVFYAPVLSTITATHISATSNQMRIFSLFDSSLSVSNSHFLGNAIGPSSSVSYRSIGGGVLLSNQSRVTMTNCQFEDNSGQNGGALYALESQINLSVCTFQRNDALGGIGGAIRAWDSNVVLVRTIFFRNTARYGGACYFLRTSVTMRNVVFRSNAATDGIGGGLYNGDGEINGQNVRFVNNVATTLGGGLYCHYTPHVSLSDVQFRNNSGTYGGAISMITTTIELNPPCTFVNNTGSLDGGSIYQTNSSSSLASCEFYSSEARSGGALNVNWRSNAVVQDCIFQNGKAISDGGAIYVNQNSSIGISYSNFSVNEANRGGAISVEDQSFVSIGHTTLTKNSAEYGGALYLRDFATAAVVTSKLVNNSATEEGGAIGVYENSMVTLIDTVVLGNEDEERGGIYVDDSSTQTDI